MTDSERAANIALTYQIPVGLHLNFDQEFNGARLTDGLKLHHYSTTTFLNSKNIQ